MAALVVVLVLVLVVACGTLQSLEIKGKQSGCNLNNNNININNINLLLKNHSLLPLLHFLVLLLYRYLTVCPLLLLLLLLSHQLQTKSRCEDVYMRFISTFSSSSSDFAIIHNLNIILLNSFFIIHFLRKLQSLHQHAINITVYVFFLNFDAKSEEQLCTVLTNTTSTLSFSVIIILLLLHHHHYLFLFP
jgi:hypothetical protein